MYTLLGIFPVDKKLYTFESQLNPFYLVLDEGIIYFPTNLPTEWLKINQFLKVSQKIALQPKLSENAS